MKFLIKIALKELASQKKLLVFMTLSLFLGLLSFSLIDAFKNSLSRHIENKSQEMFTADIRIFGRRDLSDREKEYLTQQFGETNISSRINFYSMASLKEQSRFVELSIVDEKYPLYGEIFFEDFQGNPVAKEDAFAILQQKKNMAIYPEIAYAFSLTGGEKIKLGDQVFQAALIVKKDAGAEMSFSGLAPRIYILKDQFDLAPLKKGGNLVRYYYYTKTEQQEKLGEIRENVHETFRSFRNASLSPFVIRSHESSGSQLENILAYISSYLSLVSLIAIFLAGVGIAYLFRNFVHEKIKETAIMRTLGLKQEETFLISTLQLCFVALLACALTLISSFFFIPYIPTFFERFLPDNFEMSYSVRSFFVIFAVSITGAVVFCLPILIATKDLSLNYLFTGQIRRYGKKYFSMTLSLLLIVAVFFAAAILLSEEWLTGAIFTAAFFGLFAFIFFAALLAIGSLKFFFSKVPFLLDFVIKSIQFNRFSTVFFFLSLSLGTMLITTILQMERSINEEISQPAGVVYPTFFLFNIPDDQVKPLKKFVEQKNQNLENITPLLGARVTHINNEEIKTFDRIEFETPDRERWRERDSRRVNISYRNHLTIGEKIVEGLPFDEAKVDEGLFKLSIEEGYSQERDVHLGDILTFQMIDLPHTFDAKVVNLREVKWNTFQPNFWIILEPNALQTFPKVFLSSISRVDEKEKVALQSAIVRNFPDVSLIDVVKIIEEVLGIAQQIGVLVKVMALFSIVLGLFILFSIVHHQATTRWKEINLLKVLGLSFAQIRNIVMIEYAILAAFSTMVGALLGIVLSFAISFFFFENNFTLAGYSIILLCLSICVATVVICLLASQKTLMQPTNKLLKESAI